MITNGFLQYFGKIINFAAIINATVLKYDPKVGSIEVREILRRQKYILSFTVATHTVYGSYDLIQLLIAFRSQSQDFYGMMIMLVWGLVYFWAAIALWNLRTRGDDLARIFNQLVKFDQKMEKLTGQQDIYKLLEILTCVMSFVFLTGFIVWSIILYKIQEKDAFLFSLVPDPYKSNTLLFFFTLFEAWSKTLAIFNAIWDQFFLMVTLLIHSCWLRYRITSPNISRSRTPDSDYTYFHILSKYINASQIPVKTSFLLAIMFLFMWSGYLGLIRLPGRIDLDEYLLFPVLVLNCHIISLLIFLPGAYLYNLAKKFRLQVKSLMMLETDKEGKVRRRVAKSLQLFGLQLTEDNFVQGSHLLSYYLSLSTYVLSGLVAFQF
ncbi:hypothetical protein Fcan01_25254 [Folsomia candida]|uniref:Uncharacterized protein n=1 Tax=Folsomia candida TaxID=158441 RepID=A0A226D6U9_FOLCA|nr:hypothetical protein Fcan01_25254 [Folsomia candida]